MNAGEADATIVWKENVSNESQIVQTTELDKYVKTVPAATLTSAQDTEAITAFNEYLIPMRHMQSGRSMATWCYRTGLSQPMNRVTRT